MYCFFLNIEDANKEKAEEFTRIFIVMQLYGFQGQEDKKTKTSALCC